MWAVPGLLSRVSVWPLSHGSSRGQWLHLLGPLPHGQRLVYCCLKAPSSSLRDVWYPSEIPALDTVEAHGMTDCPVSFTMKRTALPK